MTSKPRGALPVSRIMTIMKSSSDAENIGKESSPMMAKAAELFIKLLAHEAYNLTNNGKKLDYKHISEVVNRDNRYEFLRDIMPKKITYAEYKRLQGVQEKEESTSEEESDSDETGSDSQ